MDNLLNMKLRVIFLILLLHLPSFCHAKSLAANHATIKQTFTLNHLAKIDTAVLRGSQPAYTFYLPIPKAWQVNALDLDLVVQFSPLLNASSNLTLLVGDIPISSISLDKTKDQPLFWKVSIPKANISKKVTTIRIVGDMKISENVCQDIENQGNWVTISGNSNVTYHYNTRPVSENLADFPFPFIQQDAPVIDKVTFFMPKKTNLDDTGPVLQMANILTKAASWRGVKFNTKTLDQFKDSSITNPAIIIGTPNSIAFSQLGLTLPLSISNNKWYLNNYTPLEDNAGFAWLTSNTPHKEQALLIISANTKQGINTIIDAMRSNTMHFTATNPALFIAKPAHDKINSSKHNSTISFADLNYKDTVVFGSKEHQINYMFNVTEQYSNEPVKLILIYSHSPFLQKSRPSTIAVSLNNIPISGAILNYNFAKQEYIELELPKEQIKLGKNTLTVTFNLMLKDNWCSRSFLSQAWGIIYANSYLLFTPTTQPLKNQISSYPYSLEHDVILALPKDEAIYQDTTFLNALIKFVSSLQQTTDLTVMDNQLVTPKLLTHNLIYFATDGDKSFIIKQLQANFKDLVNNLNITANKSLQFIDKSLFINAFTKEQDMGFVSIASSKTDNKISTNTTQLTLFGFTVRDLKLALDLLNDSFKLESLTSNLAVAFKNGTYTNLSTTEIQEQVQAEVNLEKTGKLTLKIILYSFIAIIVLLILFFVIRSTRNR